MFRKRSQQTNYITAATTVSFTAAEHQADLCTSVYFLHFASLLLCCGNVHGFLFFENAFNWYVDPLLKFQGTLEVPSLCCKTLAWGTPFQLPAYLGPSVLQWDELPTVFGLSLTQLCGKKCHVRTKLAKIFI